MTKTHRRYTTILVIHSALAVILPSVSSVQAQQVVGGQCGICGQWYVGSHSCSAPASPQQYPGNSSGSGESNAQRLSREANRVGIEYHNRGDYLDAIRQYRLALQHSPDNVYAEKNLRSAIQSFSRECNNAGAEFHRKGDFHSALRYYQLALQYRPENAVARDNLERAWKSLQDQLAAAKEAQEQEELRRKIAASKLKIHGILERVKGDFDGRRTGTPHSSSVKSGLDFTESFAANKQPHLDSSVVDLRDRTTDTVDPRKVKGTTSSAKPPAANPKTIALLDALEAGQGNWDKSLDWLRARIVKNSSNDEARDAYQFVVGISEGLGERIPKSPLDDINLPDRPGATGSFRNPKSKALVLAALAAVADEDYWSAHKQFADAHQADPSYFGIRDCMNWSEGLAAAQGSHPHSPIVDDQLIALAREQIVKDVQESESRQQEQAMLEHIRRLQASRKQAPPKGNFQRVMELLGR